MLTAWHFSPEKGIKRFDLKYINMGLGTTFYGGGIYLTFDKSVIDYYIELIKQRPVYVYEVAIPETLKVFNEFDTVKSTNRTALGTYADLVENLGSEAKATKEIVKLGVDAIEYYSPEDKHSIVVYNPSKLKILSCKEINA